ncbi:hypothetical protein CAEBREN_04528 [Caenorhabditis brenneri]|uniref:Uncharacterized protein n=1 Tax=Caenorhabditis brenneri TaxID=135651 RepID=G0MQZ4_CAEBE|nr:hypothetical protein CAEBREN_04528 [Caenorhabditis brenneri]
MPSNYSLRNGSRKRPHAQNAWKPEFQPIFDVLRSGFFYSKGEQCIDEDKNTYVEEVLMSEYLEVGEDMTTFETCDLVLIIQPIRDFEDTEGVPQEAKRRATELAVENYVRHDEIAVGLRQEDDDTPTLAMPTNKYLRNVTERLRVVRELVDAIVEQADGGK